MAQKCQEAVEGYVAALNAELAAGTSSLATRGPCSKYTIEKADGTAFYGSLELTWAGEPFKGIACKLDSSGT